MTSPRWTGLVTATLAACGVVLAAQQLAPAPTFRSRVDAIEIEMRVSDRDGRAITDLNPAEVEVLEDGRPQQIIAFSRVSVPVLPVEAGRTLAPAFRVGDVASNRSAETSRIFVLILDDLHVDSRNTQQVKGAARRFVEQHVQPGDLVSVVYTGIRPDAAQDFTTDRRLLLSAIDKFIGRKLPPAAIERMQQYNTLFRARGRPGFEDLRDPHDGERAANARAAMASIEAISRVLARVTGRRKAALLFSEGVDYDLSGLRSQGRSAGATAGPTVLPSTIPTGGSEADALGRLAMHSYADDVLLSLQAAIGAAARANVAIYPMDVHGGNTADTLADLGAPIDDPSLGLSTQHVVQEMRDAQGSLWVLASNTGGFAALNPSDYDAAFARIVRESSEYYLLAYSPWNPVADGRYRDISVRVKRAGVRVSARDGYYAPRQVVRRTVRFVGNGVSEETSDLVMGPVPTGGLSLETSAAVMRRDKKKADVIITTQLDGRELAESSARPDVINTLELALIALDSAGKVHAATARAIDVRLNADASRIMSESGYRIVSRVQLPPGRYQIRQAVRERYGRRQGSVFADFEVPDFSRRLTISSILMSSARANAAPTSVDPETYERWPVLPSVRRTFRPDDVVVATAEIYPARRAQDIQVNTTLKNFEGQTLFRRDVRVTAGDLRAGSYRHAVKIPLVSVAGDLMLGIEAFPVGSTGDHAERRVAFRVEPK